MMKAGSLAKNVRRNPYSVLLFDEIEKAHPDVFNILLQVLDDGHITDAHGRKVDFKQTIIIMTSNVGAQAIIEPKKLGFMSQDNEKQDYERMKSGVMEEVRRLFKPEFLNRIDEIMVFHPLKNAGDQENREYSFEKFLRNDVQSRWVFSLKLQIRSEIIWQNPV